MVTDGPTGETLSSLRLWELPSDIRDCYDMEHRQFTFNSNVKGVDMDPFQDLLVTIAEGER
jgi:hypothetical protein